jgi:AcrR family transcriptional regulator
MEEHDLKAKLLTGAASLFSKFGVRSITMDEIARQLGISKKTIYIHVKDKDEMVELVVRGYLKRQELEFEKIFKSDKNVVEKIIDLSISLRENLRDINPSLLHDIRKYHPRAWDMWLKFEEKSIRSTWIMNLKEGISQGYFRENLNIDVLVTLRLELIQMAFNESIFPRDKYRLHKVQIELFDHFLHGILTEKGEKLYKKYIDKNT